MFELIPGLGVPGLILLMIMAFGVESRFSQRMTIAANAVILWSIFWASFTFFGTLFFYWFLGSIIAAVISVVSYFKFHLPSKVHDIFYALYSSKTILGVVLATAFGLTSVFFIFVIIIWFLSVYYLGHRPPFTGE